jgi:hypothetical protein
MLMSLMHIASSEERWKLHPLNNLKYAQLLIAINRNIHFGVVFHTTDDHRDLYPEICHIFVLQQPIG